jgi:hypothetical protein
VNEVFVRSTPNPMPIGQRYGSTDLLLPFESRHYSHQSLVTRARALVHYYRMEWNDLAVYGFVTLSMGDLVFGVSVGGFLFFFYEGG